MTLRNVRYTKVGSLTPDQKKELGISSDIAGNSIIAIETHNSQHNVKAVILKKGVVNYVLNGN